MPRPRPTEPFLEPYRGQLAIVWWDGGQRRRLATGTADATRARQALEDFRTQLDARPLKLSVAEALDRYVAEREGKITALSRLKEAAKPLKAALGQLRVDQVHQTQWDSYARSRVTQPPRRARPDFKPRPVSSGTLRREFNVLRATLRRAWKAGHLARPPALEPPADSAPRDRYLTKDEARRLLEACVAPHVKVFVALAIFTGARRASILALTWDRVDFRHGRVDFQEPGRRLTAKRRGIAPMNASLRTILEEAHQIRESDYVVEYAGGPVPHGLRWSFARLCTRAKLTWRPTPHHLKHSVASWLAMERVPIDQAADLLQTDPRTLRRTYRKFDPDYLADTVAALEL